MSILKSGVVDINLSDNNIKSGGLTAIAEYVESDLHLERLRLDRNGLNDNDAMRLSQALGKNTHLESLSVCYNKFTIKGVKVLFKAIFDSSSLNLIHHSNHYCHVHMLSSGDMRNHIESLNTEHWEEARRAKMEAALGWCAQRRVLLLRYVENVPVELIPNVIAFIQAYIDEEDFADAIFSIMRWWNMPSLYMHYSSVSTRPKKRQRWGC